MPGRGGWDRQAAEVARRETLERLHGMLAERIGEMGSGREWQAWLRFASSFHTYSFSNTVLIWAQKADATMVSPQMARQPAVGVGRVAEAPVWVRTDRPVLTGSAVERRAIPSKRAAHTSVGVRR